MIKLITWLLYHTIWVICLIFIGILALLTWEEPAEVIDKLRKLHRDGYQL